MPIRVNLLAEARTAEDLRRRDPVKRSLYVCAFVVSVAVVWTSSLQLDVMLAKNGVTKLQTEIVLHTNEYMRVVLNRSKVADAKLKVMGLKKLTATRFLQGNLLNALQQTTVDGVQLLRIKVDQSYYSTPGEPPRTNESRVIPGRPAKAREKIVVLLDARDSSQNPGDQVNKFKEAVANQSYFKDMLNKTNSVQLSNLPPPQTGSDGKAFQLFTLECDFPEQTR
jgi:hypothetical protein